MNSEFKVITETILMEFERQLKEAVDSGWEIYGFSTCSSPSGSFLLTALLSKGMAKSGL